MTFLTGLFVASAVIGIVVGAIQLVKWIRREGHSSGAPKVPHTPEVADIIARLVAVDQWHGRGHSIIIENRGPGEARQVTIGFAAGSKCPIPQSELVEKLPVPVLHPGTDVKLMAAVSMDCHPPFDVSVRWTDQSGRNQEKPFRLT